jgi:hypothetical protein
MRAQLEYDRQMRYGTGLLVICLALALTPAMQAQVNGVPPSVTSFGFGGQPGWKGVPPSVTSFGFGGQSTWHGVPPSVTSLGPLGYTPRRGTNPAPPTFGSGPHPGHHHPPRPDQPIYPVYPVYPYYYGYYLMPDPSGYGPPVAESATEPEPQEEPEEYKGGPTIFDRRGSGMLYPNEYASDDPTPVPKAHPESGQAPSSAPERPQPATVLVFKDGHKQEVENYAIVGSSIFDLSSGRRQKIAVADLDVGATQKANEDRGVDFKLPELPAGS